MPAAFVVVVNFVVLMMVVAVVVVLLEGLQLLPWLAVGLMFQLSRPSAFGDTKIKSSLSL